MIANCEVCNELGTPVTLAGGVAVTLCNPHRREWNTAGLASAEYEALLLAEAKLTHATQHPQGAEYLRHLAAALIGAKRAMMAFAEKWLADARAKGDPMT